MSIGVITHADTLVVNAEPIALKDVFDIEPGTFSVRFFNAGEHLASIYIDNVIYDVVQPQKAVVISGRHKVIEQIELSSDKETSVSVFIMDEG